jgi:hypothetical protein
MTTLELQRALLAHYNLAKQRAGQAETFEDAKRIIKQMLVHKGLCYCAHEVFFEHVYDEEWVIGNAPFGKVYWRSLPSAANTKEEIIERLQLRIDILTKEINNHE